MLDLDTSIKDLAKKYGEMDADRAARLEVIHEQGARVGELEAERSNLKAQLDSLSQSFAFAEADRAARLEVIHQQGARARRAGSGTKQPQGPARQLESELCLRRSGSRGAA